MSSRLLAAAVFLLSTAVLAFEILLLRIFAIETFHHFAHMAIGIALLGFGASGALLVLVGPRLRGRESEAFALLCALASLSLIIAPVLSHGFVFDPLRLRSAGRQWVALVGLYLVLAIPFVASGAAIALALQEARERVGRVYAWNLAGSAAGTALSLFLLSAFTPPRALAVAAVPASVAAVAACLRFRPRRSTVGMRAGSWMAAAAAAVSLIAVYRPPWQPRISPEKGLARAEAIPGAQRVAEDWGPGGWVAAVRTPGTVYAPGLSLAYRGAPPNQIALFVDAEAAGAATLHDDDRSSLEFLHWLPASAAYAVVDQASSVLVIGPGGGLDILAGLARGAHRVTGIEAVPALARVADEAVPPASRIYTDPRVTLKVGDARAFVAGAGESYDVIVLPPQGALEQPAAVQDLSEDYLNTVEAYAAYLARLAPGGVLAITRWLRSPPADNLKVILTAGEALRAIGTSSEKEQMVHVRSWSTGTLLIKPDGFTIDQLRRLDTFASERLFALDRASAASFAGAEHNALARPIYEHALRAVAEGAEHAHAFARRYPLDVAPATDDRPYFGSFARVSQLAVPADRSGASTAQWGGITLLATLFQSTAAAVLLLLAPLILLEQRGARSRRSWQPARIAAYFCAVGFGFVFVEIAAIQRLSLVLGHPVLAAAATIAALLAFSGIGSALSDRLPPRLAPLACTAVALLAAVMAAGAPQTGMLTGLPPIGRAAAALILVALPGVVLGTPFPLGLRRLAGDGIAVAWAWAASGFASVVGASLAALLSLEIGGAGVLAAGAACYGVAAMIAYTARAAALPATVRDRSPAPGGAGVIQADIAELR